MGKKKNFAVFFRARSLPISKNYLVIEVNTYNNLLTITFATFVMTILLIFLVYFLVNNLSILCIILLKNNSHAWYFFYIRVMKKNIVCFSFILFYIFFINPIKAQINLPIDFENEQITNDDIIHFNGGSGYVVYNPQMQFLDLHRYYMGLFHKD